MHTILTKKIDDHEIVTGFCRAVMDPMGTKKRVDNVMIEELQELDKLERNLMQHQDAVRGALRNGVNIKNIDKLKDKTNTLRAKLIDEKRRVEKLRKDKFLAEPIYFEPKKGEEIVDDVEYNALKNAHKTLAKKEVLKRDGSKVSDLRGLKYWTKTEDEWSESKIEGIDINKPDGAKWDAELTKDDRVEILKQKDSVRISLLTPSQKESELAVVIDRNLNAAAIMKSKLEIQGNPNALQTSQDWYNEQKNLAEKRYA